ncbi:MAG: hypothetical protein BWY20_00627 [Spirochaetes bacterium ADurb.Bin215]|nr:MAG: hypothetical protein BWY20_00627 [Spirochaetes bacterium ADurb.Bin215]
MVGSSRGKGGPCGNTLSPENHTGFLVSNARTAPRVFQ